MKTLKFDVFLKEPKGQLAASYSLVYMSTAAGINCYQAMLLTSQEVLVDSHSLEHWNDPQSILRQWAVKRAEEHLKAQLQFGYTWYDHVTDALIGTA